MRILTVRQPWAWSIIHAGKDVENRSTNIAGSYRGPVAIHSGLKDDLNSWILFEKSAPNANDLKEKILKEATYGVILGVVDLVDVHRCFGAETICTATNGGFPCSSWALTTEKYHLVLARPRPINPIPYKGSRGLTAIRDEGILTLIKNQLQ